MSETKRRYAKTRKHPNRQPGEPTPFDMTIHVELTPNVHTYLLRLAMEDRIKEAAFGDESRLRMGQRAEDELKGKC